MKKGLAAGLTATFLVVTLLLMGGFNLAKPRILVLHSGERQSSATARMDEGIRRVLDKNRQPLSLRWHYMGIAGLPDEHHREDASKEGRRAVDQFDPHVILAVDDEAQQYVASYYAGKVKPKIVYTAIDGDPALYGYTGAANVTGVREVLPLPAIRDALLFSRKGQPARLAVIGNTGVTGKGELAQVKAFDWAPHTLVEVHSLAAFPAWQSAINGMQGKADALLVLSYDKLQADATSRQTVPVSTVVRWIETHARPMPVGIRTEYVELGGGLGIAPSPRAMGSSGAEMALAWLKSGSAVAPPVVESSHYSVALREAPLIARGITLPSIYVEAARLNNFYFP